MRCKGDARHCPIAGSPPRRKHRTLCDAVPDRALHGSLQFTSVMAQTYGAALWAPDQCRVKVAAQVEFCSVRVDCEQVYASGGTGLAPVSDEFWPAKDCSPDQPL